MLDQRIGGRDFVAMNRADVARRQRKRKPPGPKPVPVSSVGHWIAGDLFTLRPTGERSVRVVQELHPQLLIFSKIATVATKSPGKAEKFFCVVMAANSLLSYHAAGDPGRPDSRVLIPAAMPVYPIR